MMRNGQQTCEVAPPERILRRSVSQLGSDVITLMELQAELLQVDLKEWVSGVVKSTIALVAALVLLLASTPILLMALGYALSEWTDLSLAVCMLMAAGVGILLAAICAGLGVWLLKRDKGVLHRFSTELRRNIRWLKQVLTRPSTATGVE
jgi:hypothetical protein